MKPPFTTLALLLTGLAGPFWAMHDDSVARMTPPAMEARESIQRLLDMPVVVEHEVKKCLASLIEPSLAHFVQGLEMSCDLASSINWSCEATHEVAVLETNVGVTVAVTRGLRRSTERRTTDTVRFVVRSLRNAPVTTTLARKLEDQRCLWRDWHVACCDQIIDRDRDAQIDDAPSTDESIAWGRYISAMRPHIDHASEMLRAELHETWDLDVTRFVPRRSWRQLTADLGLALQIHKPLPSHLPIADDSGKDQMVLIDRENAGETAAAGESVIDQRRIVLGVALALDRLANQLHDFSDQLVDFAYDLPNADASRSATQTARRR